jgi:hypothetical protein
MMMRTDKIEAFLMHMQTVEGYPLAIGGFCIAGMKDLVKKNYQSMKDFRIGSVKDAFLVDYLLGEGLKERARKEIVVVGASIKVQGVETSTGGVIGDPFEQIASSDKTIERLTANLYLITRPGGPGIALKGNLKQADRINDYLSIHEQEVKKEPEKFIKQIEIWLTDFVVVFDGSGNRQKGCVAIKSEGKTEVTFL